MKKTVDLDETPITPVIHSKVVESPIFNLFVIICNNNC